MPNAKTIKTVVDSASLEKNGGMGGHILQHIHGETSAASQLGKTLFATRKGYQYVWNCFLWYAPDVSCTGKSKLARISVETLKIRFFDAYSCTAVDADGRCTSYKSYMASHENQKLHTDRGQYS